MKPKNMTCACAMMMMSFLLHDELITLTQCRPLGKQYLNKLTP